MLSTQNMPAPVIQSRTSLTRRSLAGWMRPSTAYVSHATGRRTVLNPRCARLCTNFLVMGGFPQPVSHDVVFSSVLPMLMPGLMAADAVHASRSAIGSGAGEPGVLEVHALGECDRDGGVRQPAAATTK